MENSNKKSEIRKAYFMDKYVIITPGRAKRPRDVKEQTVIKRTSDCPFCAENLDKKNIVDEYKDIVSIKNIFPAVSLDNKNAYGQQEVIIETPEHEKELAGLDENKIEALLKMYARRTKEISKNKKIDYILCFKNQGSKAGASIVHAHSQVFASKILPPDIINELSKATGYENKNGTCPYCDIIKKEMEKKERKVYEDEHVAVFTPYASEYHYEVWFFTKRHLDNITKANDEEFKSLTHALKKILVKLQKLDLSFNFFLHQVISNNNQHFYLKIQPRDSVWAGVELGSGLVINSISPETAAEYYKKD